MLELDVLVELDSVLLDELDSVLLVLVLLGVLLLLVLSVVELVEDDVLKLLLLDGVREDGDVTELDEVDWLLLLVVRSGELEEVDWLEPVELDVLVSSESLDEEEDVVGLVLVLLSLVLLVLLGVFEVDDSLVALLLLGEFEVLDSDVLEASAKLNPAFLESFVFDRLVASTTAPPELSQSWNFPDCTMAALLTVQAYWVKAALDRKIT